MNTFLSLYRRCQEYIEAFDEYEDSEDRTLEELQEVRAKADEIQNEFLPDGMPPGIGVIEELASTVLWAAECELATLSISETERHQEIADRLVNTCRQLGLRPKDYSGSFPRLKECLQNN